jgi:uncharacterized protein (TIGR03437 family)
MFALGGLLKPTMRSIHLRNFQTLRLIVFGCLLAAGVMWLSPFNSGLAARFAVARTTPVAAAQPHYHLNAATITAATGQDLQQQTCTLECTATVPATGSINMPVAFQATATATSCVGAATYEWNFGDGSAKVTQQNPNYSYTTAGTFNWTLTTRASTGTTGIDTIVGGLGEGNPALKIPLNIPLLLARDPQGRGVYIYDYINTVSYIRFVNTGTTAFNLAGRTVAPGTSRFVAGGGLEVDNNVSALQTDLGNITGIAVSNDGNILFVALTLGPEVLIRAINVSPTAVTLGSLTIQPGRISTIPVVSDPVFGSGLSVITVGPNGDLFVADATSDINRIFRITPTGAATVFAGSGIATPASTAFVPGVATSISLSNVRALEFDPAGNLYVADTGHGRIIKIDTSNQATLLAQFTAGSGQSGVVLPPYTQSPPHPAGLAFFNGKLYFAMGNAQTIVRLDGSSTPIIAGAINATCDYSTTNCGDGGPIANARFSLTGSTAPLPTTGLEADANGIFLLDQGPNNRGRLRFLNLGNSATTVAGVTIGSNNIDTVAGNGLVAPYDGSLASSASISLPVGVALDANGNLYFTDIQPGHLRFVNRGTTPVTLFAGTDAQITVQPGNVARINSDVNSGGPGNDVPATQATFNNPQGIFVTNNGIYIADSSGGPTVPGNNPTNGRRTSTIRFINTTSSDVTLYPNSATPIVVPPGNITRIAGKAIGENGDTGPGDNGFALDAQFIGMTDLVVTSNGTIYAADPGYKRVRRINPLTGVVTSLTSLPGHDSRVFSGLALDTAGRLYITSFNLVISVVNGVTIRTKTDGQLLRETAAGSGSFARLDSGSMLNGPLDVAVDANNVAYVVNSEMISSAPGANAHRVMRVAADGTVTTLAGTTKGFSGDGGAAAGAQLNVAPSNLLINSISKIETPLTANIVTAPTGEIIFADSNNSRLRQLSPSFVTCTKTGQITIAGQNPTPVLTSINPTSALQGSGALTLTVTGTGFVPASIIRWNGTDRTTTFVSTTQLTTQIPASDIVNAGTAQITVFNPTPGGGTSSAQTFTITAPNPVPTINTTGGLNPNSAVEGGPSFTLTVNGTNFVNGSVVRWDGTPRTTTFVSATQLTAQIESSDLVGTGASQVTVFNPAPGGGVSNGVSFTINQNNPVPTLTNLAPNSATAGGAEFTLTVTGTNFVTNSQVRWNGNNRTTTFLSSTQLSAVIPASDIASAGSAQVTVFNPAPGGGVTAALTFTINVPTNPVPTITSLTPSSTPAGGSAFTLTVNGTNFVNGAVVRWNGADRTTTFGSATSLSAQITAADIANTGTAQVTVFNPAPGGGTSAAATFNITVPANPSPTLTNLNPNSALAGGAAFALTLTGTGFINSSVVRWNGSDRSTTFGSSTQLTAQITAADIVSVGTAQVTVFNPASAGGGGGTSAPLTFTITLNNPAPTITNVNPNSLTAGGAAFTLTVNGTNFINSSVVRWNGADRTTTFVNNTQLTAQIPAADIANAGTASITVFNPAPGGGTSNSVSVGIIVPNPVPTLTSLNPTSAVVGSGAFTLTLNGTNFVPTSVVQWNGQNRTTNFANSSQLTAQITAADIANAGTAQVTVVNPAPGGGTSNALTFNIVSGNPVPTLTSLNPNSALVGSPNFTITVTGTNFVQSSVVRWNGDTRQTTFVNATTLTVIIGAADIANAGTAQITVQNPAPGGGTSNALPFTINNPAPTITSLNPTSAQAGNGAFTLTVNGTGFVNGSLVRWNGSTRTTSFVSATQLTAQITVGDIASAGTAQITVFNGTPGGGTSNAVAFTIAQPNPVPTLTSLSPNTVNVNSGAFTLTVNGTNFVNGSVVRVNGNARTTQFVSATQLTAQILAADIASTGTAPITVFNPAPGGGTSSALNLTIVQPNPAPTIVSLTPNSVLAGSAPFTLTITGTGFINSSSVWWNNAARPSTFVNATTLTVQVPAADVANAGTAGIKVVNPAPGGGTSNEVLFSITQSNPVPTLTMLAPQQALAGSNAFTLTVLGSGFVQGAVVRWNGSPRMTNFVNPTQLTAQITAADVAAIGTAQVTVFNAPPSAGPSNALTFTITGLNPTPVITSITPNPIAAGGAAFTLTVNGTGFISTSRIRFNGVERDTVLASPTQLTTQITAAEIANPSSARITVINPAPGGGISNEVTLTIARPLANVSAASYLAQMFAPESIVAAFGTSLATGNESARVLPLPTTLRGTTVRVRDSAGTERLAQLFFVSAGQVNYLMPAGTAAGLATVIITSGNGDLSVGTVMISNVAPGIFTANANGAGVAAAVILRVKANGQQVFEVASELNPNTNRFVPVPIDLGPEGDQVFLVTFATGVRGRSAPNTVTANLGGINLPVFSAGPQGDLAGLDQLNLGPVPRSLAGRGVVDLVVTVDGKAANTVQFSIR